MKKSFYYHLGLEQFKNSFPVIIKTDRSCYLEISELNQQLHELPNKIVEDIEKKF